MSRVVFALGSLALLLTGCPEGGDDTSAGDTTGTSTSDTTGTSAGDTTGTSTSDTTGTSTGSGTASSTGGDELDYCPGVPEVDEPCREDADCSQPSAYCSPYPNDCPGAGCYSECRYDDECGRGYVCEYTGTGCCALDTRTCVPVCTAERCAEGDACQPDGHCTSIPCDDGYTCPEGWSCAPMGPAADDHGCALIPCDQAGALPCGEVFACVARACQRIPCTTNDECPCGTCMAGECWERPWLCTEPAA